MPETAVDGSQFSLKAEPAGEKNKDAAQFTTTV